MWCFCMRLKSLYLLWDITTFIVISDCGDYGITTRVYTYNQEAVMSGGQTMKIQSIRWIGGWAEITIPLLDRHNDHTQIYIRPQGDDEYLLTDDEYTLNDLKISGYSIDTPEKKALLDTTIYSCGAKLDGNAIEVVADWNTLQQKMYNILKAIIAVNTLFNPDQVKKTEANTKAGDEICPVCKDHKKSHLFISLTRCKRVCMDCRDLVDKIYNIAFWEADGDKPSAGYKAVFEKYPELRQDGEKGS